MLLSKSARFPNGIANGSDMVGRNVTFHEYSAAIGHFDDPIYAWAGGGYVSASSLPVLRARRDQRVRQWRSHRLRRSRHPAADQLGPARPAALGCGRQAMDQEFFNHSMAVAMVVHDMPQHDNRVELDDKVTDAWDLPVARITLTTHENDLRMGRFLVDRDADILEAAGATKIHRVYLERVTGNCSHQHGTTRMGNDPNSSVLNRSTARRTRSTTSSWSTAGRSRPAPASNPTLTIMANAWRVAEHIAGGRDAKGEKGK